LDTSPAPQVIEDINRIEEVLEAKLVHL